VVCVLFVCGVAVRYVCVLGVCFFCVWVVSVHGV